MARERRRTSSLVGKYITFLLLKARALICLIARAEDK